MSENSEPIIQPLTNFSEKGRPNRPRTSSRYYAVILEQLSFVLCLDMQQRERKLKRERFK